jgi:hypothetical protein
MDNIVADAAAVKLEEEAAIIQRECAAADAAGLSRLAHAIEAGKHALKVRNYIKRGFRSWLHAHDLKKTTLYDYMLLAEHEERVRSSGHSSIASALRMLRTRSNTSNRTTKAKESLARHWKREKELARTAFLDEIGIDEFRLSMSLTFYRRLRDLVRVERVESDPSGKGTTLLKKALSHIRAADASNTSETAAAADIHEAANCLRALLKTLGNDPNSAVFGISAAAKKKTAA